MGCDETLQVLEKKQNFVCAQALSLSFGLKAEKLHSSFFLRCSSF
jgi:hypothetical protein